MSMLLALPLALLKPITNLMSTMASHGGSNMVKLGRVKSPSQGWFKLTHANQREKVIHFLVEGYLIHPETGGW